MLPFSGALQLCTDRQKGYTKSGLYSEHLQPLKAACRQRMRMRLNSALAPARPTATVRHAHMALLRRPLRIEASILQQRLDWTSLLMHVLHPLLGAQELNINAGCSSTWKTHHSDHGGRGCTRKQ